MRCFQVAVQIDVRKLLGDLVVEPIAQHVQALRLGAHFRFGDPAGFAQADAQRGREGAGSHAALLTAAADQRFQANPRAAST